jgi:hypothetical protein
MNTNLIEHMRSQLPVIDVMGKYLFFKNDKVASRSIAFNALSDRSIIQTYGCKRNYNIFIEQLSDEDFESMFKFSVVRNPWERAVSCFHHLQERGQIRKTKLAKCADKFINPKETFSHFVKNTLAIHGIATNRSFHCQYPNAFFRGKIFVDFVARFENIKKDWEFIASRIDTDPVLPHDNKSNHKFYTDYYDDECIEIINTIYAEDISLLNYTYET